MTRTRLGVLLSALLGVVAAPAAHAQPTVDADFGALSSGVTYSQTTFVAANTPVRWYSFTVPAVTAGNGPGLVYLDIRTTNPSSNTTFISSNIGLYDAAGNLATGAAASSVDFNQGPGTTGGTRCAALSYGATCPTRANPFAPPGSVDGVAFNGRDGTLPAGTYYLAVVRGTGTFGTTGWTVTPPSTGTLAGDVTVEVVLGVTGNPPPLTTASSATPLAVSSGGSSLLTVTRGTCTATDVPTSMSINLSAVGGSPVATMYDNATNGDVTADDGVWSLTTPIIAPPGTYTLTATATNVYGLTSTRAVTVVVQGTGSTAVKISQINGTGASQGTWAGPRSNFVEVHNTSGVAIDLSGWAIQTALSTGTTWTVSPFPSGFTLAAGAYAVVQLGTQGTPYNDPNWTNDIFGFNYPVNVVGSAGALSPSGGKIALTSSQAPLSGACPTTDPSVMDFVGYGGANCSEGSPAPAMSQLVGKSIYRGCTGNTDTGQNASDFTLDWPSMRNQAGVAIAAPLTVVGLPTAAVPVSVQQNSAVLLTASASTCSGATAGLSMAANLSYVGGPASAPMFDDGTHGDITPADGVFSLAYVVPGSVLPAPVPGPGINRPYVTPIIATDALGRIGYTYAAFYVSAAPVGGACIGGENLVRTAADTAAASGVYLGDGASPFSGAGMVYASPFILGMPSPGTISDTITVPDNATVQDVVVHLYMDHSYLGDLTCTLTHSEGADTTSVVLFSRVGVGTNNATGRPGNLVNTSTYSFYDGGSSFWTHAFQGGKDTNYNYPSGVFAPSGPQNAPSSMAAFVGDSMLGDWTITFDDASITETGSFMWSIEFNPPSACGGSTGCNLADITESGGTLEEPGSPDGQLTLDDILVFIDAYNDAAGCPGSAPCNLADITESGGTFEEPGSPDGQLTLDDILVFIDAYNNGC